MKNNIQKIIRLEFGREQWDLGGDERRGLNNRDSILNTEFSNHKIK